MTIFERIEQFNRGRDPQLLQIKYAKMRTSPLRFFRGSCHLFAEDWPEASSLNRSPLTWNCGDLHIENFGSYKGANRLTYFDIDDFDEAILAPCTVDLTRFLTSVLLAVRSLSDEATVARHLFQSGLEAYSAALAAGKAFWIERRIAAGLIGDLLDRLRQRRRRDFLLRLSERTATGWQLKTLPGRFFPIPQPEYEQIAGTVARLATTAPDPRFYEIFDIKRRVAGTGSIGIERYAILVQGRGSPDGHFILDLKRALPSCWQPLFQAFQPAWPDEATRVSQVQQRLQAVAPDSLHPLVLDGKPYVLKELQPEADRVDLTSWDGKPKRLESLVRTMSQIIGWAHLRASGRDRSAIADALINFAHQQGWQSLLSEYANHYSEQVVADWQEFCRASAPDT